MATRKEREIVSKLMLLVVNAYDKNRKEVPVEPPHYGETEMRPKYTLAELRRLADEAMIEAQAMLAS